MKMKFLASVIALAVAAVQATVLTPDNWEAETDGKTIFVKFYAPWSGRCKKLKPDWDKLIDAFDGHKTALIGDVDCTAEGKPLCKANGVQEFPTLKWGDPSSMENYEGARSYDALKKFADENLKGREAEEKIVISQSPTSVTFVATSNKDIVPEDEEVNEWFSIGNSSEALKKTVESSSAYKASLLVEPFRIVTEKDVYPYEDVKIAEGIMNEIVTSSGFPSPAKYAPSSGLVDTIISAYNNHWDIVLTPDVVWLTILQQFSAYVNGGDRAEQLRDRIVDFQGKRTLIVESNGTLFSAPYGFMTMQMAEEIAKNIKDPTLRTWVDPQFSTTTETDRVCAAASLMSIMQKYFNYEFGLGCGIPSVTLKGTVEDWQSLRNKIDRLLEFDLEDKLMTEWHSKLAVVLDNFLASRKGTPDLHFWDTVALADPGGSGPTYLTGWITTFSPFDSNGDVVVLNPGPNSEGEKWWDINTEDINDNVISVPITVNDNGVVYSTRMFIGTFMAKFEQGLEREGKEKEILERQGINGTKNVLTPRTDYALVVQGLRADVERLQGKGESCSNEKEFKDL